jgi:hypothetical protein
VDSHGYGYRDEYANGHWYGNSYFYPECHCEHHTNSKSYSNRYQYFNGDGNVLCDSTWWRDICRNCHYGCAEWCHCGLCNGITHTDDFADGHCY